MGQRCGCGRRRAKEEKVGKDKRALNASGVAYIDNPGRIADFYEINPNRLVDGSYSSIYAAVNKSTGFERAVKVMSKGAKKHIPQFYEEIMVMKSLDHPNIIKFFETFEDAKFIYIVMEYCKGPDFHEFVHTMGHLTEAQAAIVMQQVLRAVTYMHATQNICHRDLKTENFMLFTTDPVERNVVKILDFGFATAYDVDEETGEAEVLTKKCGAPFYVAPQVLAGHYTYQADIWSCGVLMYLMLCGYPPFYGDSDAEVLTRVRLGNYSFNAADWGSISDDAKDLVRQLLRISPKDRIDSANALLHPWIREHVPRSNELPLKHSLVSHLRGYAASNKLKRACFYVLAGSLPYENLQAQIDSFNTLDKEGDGSLGYEEFREGLAAAGVRNIPEDLADIIMDMDSDGSGKIEYTEFLAATVDKKHLTEENVWNAFRCFDQNGDGKISQTEVYRVLNARVLQESQKVTPMEVVRLMRDLDETSDKYIDFPEFMGMMRGVLHRRKKGH